MASLSKSASRKARREHARRAFVGATEGVQYRVYMERDTETYVELERDGERAVFVVSPESPNRFIFRHHDRCEQLILGLTKGAEKSGYRWPDGAPVHTWRNE